jgi:hypothetical protein
MDNLNDTRGLNGVELAERGLPVVAPGQPAAMVMTCRKVN